MKTMAIDYGDARMGIAISDETLTFSFPKETYHRVSKKKDIDYLIDFCLKNQVNRIVFGDPISMDGTLGEMHDKVVSFAKALEKKLKYSNNLPWEVEILFFDERQTTSGAYDVLHLQNSPRKRKKMLVDQIAASLILRDFLKEEKAHDRKANH